MKPRQSEVAGVTVREAERNFLFQGSQYVIAGRLVPKILSSSPWMWSLRFQKHVYGRRGTGGGSAAKTDWGGLIA